MFKSVDPKELGGWLGFALVIVFAGAIVFGIISGSILEALKALAEGAKAIKG